MPRPWVYSEPFRLGLSAVSAVFGFLLGFFYVADLFGGGLTGIGASVLVALAVFGIVYFSAPRSAESARARAPGETPAPPPGPTTIVQTPVTVNVPVQLNVDRGREPPKQEPPQDNKEGTPPAKPPIPERTESNAESDDTFDVLPTEEVIFDDVVVVNPGREGAWPHALPLQIGDSLDGYLRENNLDTFNWGIMNERNLSAFLNGDAEWTTVAGEENVKATPIHWKCSKKGKWFLVLDALGKQYGREVHVTLQWVRVP